MALGLKFHHLSPAEITFVLASGGHNAGIVSEPGHPRRRYKLHVRKPGEANRSPEEWVAGASSSDGSWWTAWIDWLDARSGDAVKPPRTGAASKGYPVLEDAPGQYVRET